MAVGRGGEDEGARAPVAPTDARVPETMNGDELAAARAIEGERHRRNIHRSLLTESLRRLRSGRHLEREHGVIHPEMTSIVRDVLRLTDLVYPSADAPEKKELAEEAAVEVVTLSAGSRALEALIARSSVSKVTRICGLPPREVSELRRGGRPTEAQIVTLETRLRIPREAWTAE